VEVHFLRPPLDLHRLVRSAVKQGEMHILAAGGDGTVNSVMNAVMQLGPGVRTGVVLGAVGLGSSNDFHKPFSPGNLIEGIPVRMNFRKTVSRDVGSVEVEHAGAVTVRRFIINASAGITAEGNAFFNAPGRLIRWLKERNTPAAILCAALQALTTHRNAPLTIEFPGKPPIALSLTNLGILKSPYFSGSLHYDVPARYDDGMFHIFAAERMGILERVSLFRALSRGQFRRLSKTHSWHETAFRISGLSPFLIELDGEVVEAERAAFSVLTKALRICT
jgi:diacylglycerol kinase family enzyme